MASLPSEVRGATRLGTAKMQGALYYVRETRRELFAQTGLSRGVSDLQIPGPDGAIPNPLPGGNKELAPVTLLAFIDSFDAPPNGILLSTGDAVDSTTLSADGAGNLTLDIVVASASVLSVTAEVLNMSIASGPHVYSVAIFVNPFDAADAVAKVYVDGFLELEGTGTFLKWASTTADWTYATPTASYVAGGATLTFADANPDTITRSGGSFVTDGFVNGDRITVSGSASNDGTFLVDAVAATVITLDAAETLAAEGPTALPDGTIIRTTNFGKIRPLEVYFDRIPAVF